MIMIKQYVYAIYYEWSKEWQYISDNCDSMHTEGWIPTGQVIEIEVKELPHHILVQRTIEVLKTEKSKIEAAAYVKAQEIQGRINDLLAIEDMSGDKNV